MNKLTLTLILYCKWVCSIHFRGYFVIQRARLSRSVRIFVSFLITLIKYTAWTLSNISSGTENQIDQVLESKLMVEVINVINSNGEFNTKKEATKAITNIIAACHPNQIDSILKFDVVDAMTPMLKSDDNQTVQVTPVFQ